jgi:hypothetical protein
VSRLSVEALLDKWTSDPAFLTWPPGRITSRSRCCCGPRPDPMKLDTRCRLPADLHRLFVQLFPHAGDKSVDAAVVRCRDRR